MNFVFLKCFSSHFYDNNTCPLNKIPKHHKNKRCVNAVVAKDTTEWLGTMHRAGNVFQMSESVHQRIGSG